MKKIVILVGSKRRDGNTETLAKAFMKGAKEHSDVEIVSVADYQVNPCIGCNSCMTKEDHRCFQKDDMNEIYDKLLSADAIVIASPVYFYGLSAQLKAIIDRLHTPLRNEFPVKKLGLLLVGAASLPELFDAIFAQYELVLSYFSLEDGGRVCVRGVKDVGDINGNQALLDAEEMGRNM